MTAVRRVLVTGGAGFIGSHLVDALLLEGVRVSVLDSLESPVKAVPAKIDLIEGTILDKATVDKAVAGAEIVFHLAAVTSVEASMNDPGRCLSVNGIGLVHVLDSARAHGVRKIVFASSSAVYDGGSPAPKREGDPVRPTSPYALSKLDGEYLLEFFHLTHGLPWVALRYFNVFGPRQPAEGDSAAVIPAFIDRALRHRDLVIFGDGTQTRDFLYVEDAVRATISAALAGHGIYNIGTGTALPILELARLIIKRTAARSRTTFTSPRPGDVRHSTADISRARAGLDWEPRVPMEEALARTISWFRSHPEAS